VRVKSVKISRSHIERLYENFLMEKATTIFGDKAKKYSKRVGVAVKRVEFQND
jgi:predicted metal-dependent hydrolase